MSNEVTNTSDYRAYLINKLRHFKHPAFQSKFQSYLIAVIDQIDEYEPNHLLGFDLELKEGHKDGCRIDFFDTFNCISIEEDPDQVDIKPVLIGRCLVEAIKESAKPRSRKLSTLTKAEVHQIVFDYFEAFNTAHTQTRTSGLFHIITCFLDILTQTNQQELRLSDIYVVDQDPFRGSTLIIKGIDKNNWHYELNYHHGPTHFNYQKYISRFEQSFSENELL